MPHRSNLILFLFSTEHGLLTAEAVTLAQQLVNRQKTKTDLLNDGFTRYSLNSNEDLPTWFLDDESKHYMANIPITKEAIQSLRAKQRALDARPIKKVAEAKARKKFKAAQRLDKAMKKAEGVTQTDDMTEREKAQQVEKLMRKGLSKGKKEKKEVKVVVAKGVNKGVKGRPKGVKGRYAMVDSRMKKEVCARFVLSRPHGLIYFLSDAGQEAEGQGEQKTETLITSLLLSSFTWISFCTALSSSSLLPGFACYATLHVRLFT